ncbi:MAG: hypothetical protein PHQ75_09515 [Thermoguttaceae bacterium]|nr:hypothetical protein [Thermoguttaceae bacterium]
MTQKIQKTYSESDSCKSSFDWSKTPGSSRYGSTLGPASVEMKRSITLLVLALVTMLALAVGLAMIWLFPHKDSSTSPVSVPIGSDSSRDYLLIRHFQVNRNALLLSRIDHEHFCVIGKGAMYRYSIADESKESWTFPRELAELEPTAVCYIDFPETNNLFFKAFVIAFGNSVYCVRPEQKQLTVNKLPLDIPPESKILSIAWGENNLFLADYAKAQVHKYNITDLKKRNVLGATSDANGFPGFHLSKTPCFGLTYSRKDDILYAANSAMFRVEAFNPESGLWLKEASWGEGPWQAEGLGFTGCCNPVGLDMLNTGQIVTTEKGKDPLVRVFNSNGSLVCQVNALGETPPMDGKSWLRIAVLNDSKLVLLSPRGTVYVYERVFNPDHAVPQPTSDKVPQSEPAVSVVSQDQEAPKDARAALAPAFKPSQVSKPTPASSPAASVSGTGKEIHPPQAPSAAKTKSADPPANPPASPSAGALPKEKK